MLCVKTRSNRRVLDLEMKMFVENEAPFLFSCHPVCPPRSEVQWRSTQSGDADGEEHVPFFVLAGLMGSERQGKPLPSHAGQSLPARFDAPGPLGSFQGLFPGSPPANVRAPAVGTSIRRSAHRPGSAPPPQHSALHAVGARPASAAPPRPRPEQAASTSVPTSPQLSARGRAKQPPKPPLQTLDRVLQKELVYGRIGFPTGHYRAPTTRMPAAFTTSLQRDRGKSKLKDMAMLPSTMRRWEEGIHRRLALRSPLRGGGVAAAAPSGSSSPAQPRDETAAALTDEIPEDGSAPLAPPTVVASNGLPTTMPVGLSPYEMRRFLRNAQRYFLAVDKKAFSVGPRDAINDVS